MTLPLTHTTVHVENLIIGSGIAGLMLAIKLAQQNSQVLVISKDSLCENNSFYAQGGIASVFPAGDDSFAAHIQDTLLAGAGLCHEEVVRTIVEAGPQVIADLIALGVEFSRHTASSENPPPYHLTQEGGHSQRRVWHAQDLTGQALIRALLNKAQTDSRIQLREYQCAIDLLTTDKYFPNFSKNYCLGAYVLDRQHHHIYQIRASRTFLCSGGLGRAYLYTSNPPAATGDGLAMGWRAGCKVANMEFMQFHPTCLFHPEAKTFLISEALRGEGAILKNAQQEAFVELYHPQGSLAPRDIVARAIDSELKKSGENYVFLDARPLGRERIQSHFPHLYATCLRFGIDMCEQMIPVVPAAHYSCGGLVIDSHGQTNVSHLYALGEVACSGLHGANRLASNSLLEACVLAERAAKMALATPPHPYKDRSLPSWDSGQAIPADEQVLLSHTWDEIRRLMWHYVGIVRSDKRLQRALARIEAIRQELAGYYWRYELTDRLLEVRNLADVAWLTVRCAISRKESRGIHYTLDYPESSAFARDTVLGH